MAFASTVCEKVIKPLLLLACSGLHSVVYHIWFDKLKMHLTHALG